MTPRASGQRFCLLVTSVAARSAPLVKTTLVSFCWSSMAAGQIQSRWLSNLHRHWAGSVRWLCKWTKSHQVTMLLVENINLPRSHRRHWYVVGLELRPVVAQYWYSQSEMAKSTNVAWTKDVSVNRTWCCSTCASRNDPVVAKIGMVTDTCVSPVMNDSVSSLLTKRTTFQEWPHI